jgi:hypothetical protein
VSFSERQSKFDLSPDFIDDFQMMVLNLQHFIKPQQAQKRDIVDALQHEPQAASTP